MKFLIALVVLILAVDADATLNRAVIESLLKRQLTISCKCEDKYQYCEFFSSQCSTSFSTRYMCPLTCGVCELCPTESPPPTLVAPVSKCEFNCKNNWSQAVCEYYKSKDQCKFFKSNCRATCEECRQCRLPPDELPACNNDCKDSRAEESCIFWKGRGLCFDTDVRYVCQKTCGACTVCPAE